MPEIEYRLEEQKLTPSDIDEVEAKLSFKFPERFRKFYLVHNGGMPLPNYFEHDGRYWQVNEIYALRYGDEVNLFESCYKMIVVGGEAFSPWSHPFCPGCRRRSLLFPNRWFQGRFNLLLATRLPRAFGAGDC